MNLVVYTNKDLQTILKAVSVIFSDIPDLKINPRKYKQMPFDNHMGRILVYNIRNAAPSVRITWQLPSLRDYNRHRVEFVMDSFLTQYGEGGIATHLEHLGISRTVDSRIEKSHQFCTFSLIVELTTDGVSRSSEVISVIYQYIFLLKSMSSVQYYSYWKEYVHAAQISFDYLSDTDPFSFVL